MSLKPAWVHLTELTCTDRQTHTDPKWKENCEGAQLGRFSGWRGETHTSMNERETRGVSRGPMTRQVTETTAKALKDQNERRLQTPTPMKEGERTVCGVDPKKGSEHP